MKAVRVHCGSAYVRGKARKYAYYIAQVFRPTQRKDGIITLRSTGIVVGPYRSFQKATREGRELAREHQAIFVDGYGSLHGKAVLINNMELNGAKLPIPLISSTSENTLMKQSSGSTSEP